MNEIELLVQPAQRRPDPERKCSSCGTPSGQPCPTWCADEFPED